MKTDTHPSAAIPVQDKRSRNKLVIGLVAFLCGLLFSRVGKFLTDYHGPWGTRLALVLGPLALIALLAVLSRRYYREDELEIFINRQALAFAFYAALAGLLVLGLLQAAGFVPVFVWTTKQLTVGLAGLLCIGILWSKRRFA